jgi:hypothetical protein
LQLRLGGGDSNKVGWQGATGFFDVRRKTPAVMKHRFSHPFISKVFQQRIQESGWDKELGAYGNRNVGAPERNTKNKKLNQNALLHTQRE